MATIKITRTCKHCGNVFSRRRATHWFCSQSCVARHYAQQRQAVRKKIIKTCETCGDSFEHNPGTKGRFCSKRCYGREIPALERFWMYVRKSDDPDACWQWTASTHKSGHGQLNINHVPVKAHRLSYEIHYGPVPAGMCVCHTCDNPPCCNPAHLWVGTRSDNLKDMWRKGRGYRGGSKLHKKRDPLFA